MTKYNSFSFVPSGGGYVRVVWSDVWFLTSDGNNVKIFTSEKDFIEVHLSMKKILAEIPDNCFARINRFETVSICKLHSFDRRNVYIGRKAFCFGARFRPEFEKKIHLIQNKRNRTALAVDEAGLYNGNK